ncbi:MAG: cupin domain-containing protein [Lachnospiraceae bacterium]|nr:cupin domain-containing protein [Lachnospiraceae bacterium]
MENKTFESFDIGKFEVPGKSISFADVPWSKHPTFEGVELKHIVTSKETGGAYSYHLVRIAPEKSILDHIHDPQLETHEVIAGEGVCINDGNEIRYTPGVISVMPSKIHHEVHAGKDGLYLFAKFMPALC